jgi:hypothetical protein
MHRGNAPVHDAQGSEDPPPRIRSPSLAVLNSFARTPDILNRHAAKMQSKDAPAGPPQSLTAARM